MVVDVVGYVAEVPLIPFLGPLFQTFLAVHNFCLFTTYFWQSEFGNVWKCFCLVESDASLLPG
jgi:hypothetical protein